MADDLKLENNLPPLRGDMAPATLRPWARLADVQLSLNKEPRCGCVLLLDTSGSMDGPAITALNEGLKVFETTLKGDDLASRRVEVAVVTFDSEVKVVQDFVTADQFQAPTLTAQGRTVMGAGILEALDLLQTRKAEYRRHGRMYYRPWIFMITDGGPTDQPAVPRAVESLQAAEKGNHVAFFAVGVEGANMEMLTAIAVRQPLRLKGLNFKELFVWLSRSMETVTQGRPGEMKPGEMVGLPPASDCFDSESAPTLQAW